MKPAVKIGSPADYYIDPQTKYVQILNNVLTVSPEKPSDVSFDRQFGSNIVELDGKIHLNQQEKDYIRDVILLQRGYKTLRIKNEEMCDVENVLRKIVTILKG